jgi:hypothetical protein
MFRIVYSPSKEDYPSLARRSGCTRVQVFFRKERLIYLADGCFLRRELGTPLRIKCGEGLFNSVRRLS